MAERNIVFEIKEHLGVLARYQTGWTKELNLISWNGQAPKFDIRDWDEEHERMSRGVTLRPQEIARMIDLYLNNKNKKVIEEAQAAAARKWDRIASNKKAKDSSDNSDGEAGGEEQLEQTASAGAEPDEPVRESDGEDFVGEGITLDATPLVEDYAAVNDGTPF